MLDKLPANEINQPATKDGGVPQENYMFARSVFLRMTSLLTRNNKPIVLMGGELLDNTLRSGMEVYGPRSGGVLDNDPKKNVELNPNLRPMAGVKDVNVEYAGGGAKIGSTRKTSISWTCWSWEELQKFKPFFLTHGKVVLIEWGWGFTGVDSPILLDIINENGEINEELINGSDNQKPLQEIIPEHILQQKGHYDALLGTIQNFEFSVNESGGFDCTTELVSLGVNTFRKMDSKESIAGQISNLPILEPVVTQNWTVKTTDYLKNQSKDKNPYYSFRSYMMSLESHLHLNANKSKGAIAYILGGDAPYCTWGWFEDNVLSRFAGQINSDKEKVVSEFRSIESIYDDLGNVSGSQPTMMRTSREVVAKDYSPKGWFFAHGGGDPTAGSKNENNSQLIHGVKSKSYPDGKVIGDFKLMFAPPYLQQGDAGQGKWIGPDDPSVSETWKKIFKTDSWDYTGAHFRVFKNDTGITGVIRNIYFGHEFLTECFEKSTIAEGIESVWNKFSAVYGGIYDFGIEFDDKEGRLMIKDKGFSQSKVKTVLENTSKNPNSDVYDNKGVFVFPIWEKTSLVKSQNLNAKLPSRMQVAAMYGNNSPEFGDGLVDDLDDWGAIALGRNQKEVEKGENAQQELLDSLLGSVEFPFKRGEKGNQFTFGNASADNNTPLKWTDGPSATTTDIYEDTTPKAGNDDPVDDKFGKGINDVLAEELKQEFQARILRASGIKETEDNKTALKAIKLDTRTKVLAAKSTFRKATTKSTDASSIYVGHKKRHLNPVIKRGLYGAKHYKWPHLKQEYHGIMKLSLTQTRGGLLKTSDPLIPIELEIEIDGTGGIFPGNTFHSSYLPKSYMDRMCFQVIGASHKIDSTGWTTTLKGQMRVAGLERKPVENIRMIEPTKSDGKIIPDVKQEINDDPNAQVIEITTGDPDTPVIEIETAIASTDKTNNVNPSIPIEGDGHLPDGFLDTTPAATIVTAPPEMSVKEQNDYYGQGFLIIGQGQQTGYPQRPIPGAKKSWFFGPGGLPEGMTVPEAKALYPDGMDFSNPALGVNRPYGGGLPVGSGAGTIIGLSVGSDSRAITNISGMSDNLGGNAYTETIILGD